MLMLDSLANDQKTVHTIVLTFFLLFGYFLPTLLAKSAHKMNAKAIFALNLLTGWTVIGWVAALVWALTKDAAGVNRRTRTSVD